MKVLRYFQFYLVALLLVIVACSTKFNVNEEWQDITVVMGLLNQADSIQYIRISKAFLGPGNELQYAKIPDSSNYQTSLEVKLNEYLGNSFVRSISLHDTQITNKDSGIFYFPVQKLYYTKSQIYQDYTYRLWIHNTLNGKIIQGSTGLVHMFDLNLPSTFPGVNILPGQITEVNWRSAIGGKRYQITVRIHYTEIKKENLFKSYHILDWTPYTDITSIDDKGGASMDYFLTGNDFYTYMGNNIPVDTSVERILGLCDFIFTVGSEDLDTYIQINETNPIMEIKPTFSNITNGIGLFASRFVQKFENYQFTQATIDSVKTNKYTSKLGF